MKLNLHFIGLLSLFCLTSFPGFTKSLFLPFGEEKVQLGSIQEEINQEVSDELVTGTQGPVSFYVDRSHNIHVLDHFKSRILQYNQRAEAIGSIPLPYSEGEESSFEDLLVLPDRSILLLDTLQSRIVKIANDKKKSSKVTHRWNEGASKQELLFLSLETDGRSIFAKDRYSGQYYQFTRSGVKPLIKKLPEQPLNYSCQPSNQKGRLAFQWNPENPYDLEFFSIGNEASKLFSIKTLRDLEGLKVLQSGKAGIRLLTYRTGEEQSVLDSVISLSWSGEFKNIQKLNLPTIPWTMSRESQLQQGFLYTAHFHSRKNGLVLRRMNLNKGRKG